MKTVNDLELNELIMKAHLLLPIVSEHVRQGHLGLALTECSKLEDAVRKANWKIWELTGKGDTT